MKAHEAGSPSTATIPLQVGGLLRATSDAVIDSLMGRRPGVLAVDANAHSGTATLNVNPAQTSVAERPGRVRGAGGSITAWAAYDVSATPLAMAGLPEPGGEGVGRVLA